MRERDIVHECGDFWVGRTGSSFTVYRSGATHSTADSSYDDLSLAVARCDYLGKNAHRMVALRFPTASGRPVMGVPIVGIEAPKRRRTRRKNPAGVKALRAHPRGGDYAWLIYEDRLDGRGVHIVGPRNPTPALVAMLDAGKGEQFRMYDDDGEWYYSGRIVRVGSASHDEGFEPLDDFGTPDSGCTEIRYLHAGKWETL